MENILLDESYSFSLRQLDKNTSRKDIGQLSAGGGIFYDQSRMSNLSAYNAA